MCREVGRPPLFFSYMHDRSVNACFPKEKVLGFAYSTGAGIARPPEKWTIGDRPYGRMVLIACPVRIDVLTGCRERGAKHPLCGNNPPVSLRLPAPFTQGGQDARRKRGSNREPCLACNVIVEGDVPGAPKSDFVT